MVWLAKATTAKKKTAMDQKLAKARVEIKNATKTNQEQIRGLLDRPAHLLVQISIDLLVLLSSG